tara:strand:+ start:54 stop:473 length:420 start_codon:yes stop_codon:yes gene_type:complete
MSAPVRIIDPHTGIGARVTEFGQLVTSPIDYSLSSQVVAIVDDLPYTAVSPEQGRSIIITSIILTANKDVGVNDATVTLYSASTAGATTGEDILQLELERNGKLVLTGLNLKVDGGLFLNIKTSDTIVYATILYYRVPV